MIASTLPQYSTDTLNLKETEKAEIDRLRVSHELYKLYLPEFDLYLSAFEGGPEITDSKNLWKHIRETTEDYAERATRVHYTNYCEPMISFFTNFIFSESIDRNGGSNTDWYINFLKNVNRKDEDIDTFMRQVSDDMQIFGMSYVLVDTPSAPAGLDENTFSKAVADELNISPYWVLIKATEVTDWVIDDFDNFDYLKRLQFKNVVTREGIRKIEHYTEWYKNHIDINQVDITDPAQPRLLQKQTYNNTLNRIPVEVCRYKRSKRYPYMGNSFLRDFASNNREVMNLTSLIQEFLYRQCFNILAVETETAIPILDQEQGAVGTANAINYPKGANAPAYISPASDPAEFLQSERSAIVQEMFKRAAQDTLNELFNGSKSSGFSQAQSFSKTVPFISNRADTLERLESNLMRITLQLSSKNWDGKIKYKDRYELTNLTDAITQLTSLARDLMIPSKTFVVEELKRLVHEYDGKIDSNIMLTIDKEIEAINWTDWTEKQQEALVGTGNSPAEQQAPKSSGTMTEIQSESKSKVGSTKKLKK